MKGKGKGKGHGSGTGHKNTAATSTKPPRKLGGPKMVGGGVTNSGSVG